MTKDKEIFYITTPQVGVNDDSAELLEWLIEDKAKVSSGDAVAIMETTKAAFDAESENSGYLIHLASVDDTVLVNEPIAAIVQDLKVGESLKEDFLEQRKAKLSEKKNTSSGKATKKALDLAKKYNVDINDITPSSSSIIRESDILSFIKENDDKEIVIEPLKDSKKKPVIIFGAGQGGNTMKEALESQKEFEVVCFLDDNASSLSNNLPIYTPEKATDLFEMGLIDIAIALTPGSLRVKLYEQLKDIGFNFINVIHANTYISPSVEIGIGNHIKSGANIETNTKIGNFCIIDNSVAIAHDNIIEDGCHLAPGVALGSNIHLSENIVIGIGASISTGVKIGKNAIISVGSSVTSDVDEYTVVEGVPAKTLGKTK